MLLIILNFTPGPPTLPDLCLNARAAVDSSHNIFKYTSD